MLYTYILIHIRRTVKRILWKFGVFLIQSLCHEEGRSHRISDTSRLEEETITARKPGGEKSVSDMRNAAEDWRRGIRQEWLGIPPEDSS